MFHQHVLRKCSRGEGGFVLIFFYVGSSANALHKASLNERDVWFTKKAAIPLITDDGNCKK